MNVFEILSVYDAVVRENESSDFPTRQNVAFCKDGYMGAFGEMLDMTTEELSGAEYEALEGLFHAYQQALRVELVGAS